jgi:hypothetical protein
MTVGKGVCIIGKSILYEYSLHIEKLLINYLSHSCTVKITLSPAFHPFDISYFLSFLFILTLFLRPYGSVKESIGVLEY